MDRYITLNRVAVLYSPGFGSGWSTWNPEYPDMVFDPGMARLIEEGRHEEALTYATLKWPDAYFGGLNGLRIEWLPVGTRFRVVEYDGNEEVEILDKIDWFVA